MGRGAVPNMGIEMKELFDMKTVPVSRQHPQVAKEN
jgi:hypothetical protein